MPKRKHDTRTKRVTFTLRNLPILDAFRRGLTAKVGMVSASEALDTLLSAYHQMRQEGVIIIERERLPELLRDPVLAREVDEQVARRTVAELQRLAPYIHGSGRDGFPAPAIVLNPETLEIGLMPAGDIPAGAPVHHGPDVSEPDQVRATLPRVDQ